ncbi:MAG: hypothetical protein Kow0042_24280 [Calditrichia bacterium]
MQFILSSAVAGIVGTAGMTLLLWAITKSNWANADMVRALGSFLTRSYHSALLPGIILKFAAGIPFGIIYIYVLKSIGVASTASLVLGGGIIGIAHGFAFSFIMVILAEHHPVEKFQEASFEVAIAHFLAHVLYGVLVGLIYGLLS